MNNDDPEDLNYDCNYNMFIAKTLIQNLAHVKDRQQAVKWMKKLSNSNNSIPEMKLRNDFMYYLVVNIQNGALKEPFTNEPPCGSIMEVSHLLPRGGDATSNLDGAGCCSSGQKPFLYSKSPDGGEFLASQPLPRCGAFCYLAVVSRSDK